MTLLVSVFVVAGCGLIYELLIATVSSYLLGSSVTHFSISIGVFIGSMGLGSHISQRIRRNLLTWFVGLEIMLALIGGFSALLLFVTYTTGTFYWLALYPSLVVIGGMVGLELPILTRELKQYGSLRKVIANALSFDYLGALTGSLLLPLLLLPSLGMMRTAFVAALVNVGIAIWNIHVFGHALKMRRTLATAAFAVVVALGAGFAFSLQLIGFFESRMYDHEVIHSQQTPFQRIVLTRWHDDVRLFLDGHLQFSSLDEYRYHEALVHPACSAAARPERVLLLGGGDGLAVREVLHHPQVKAITLIDIDPAMTELGRNHPALAELNAGALADPRVTVLNQDAHTFLRENTELWDVIIADLPDPNNEVLAKLYSVEFYRLALARLAAQGVFVTQATSPFMARDAFWCVRASVEAAGMRARGYQAYVPSFGLWGFVIAARHDVDPRQIKLAGATRFLTPESLPSLFEFGRDIGSANVVPSTLDDPRVLHYYLASWEQYRGGKSGTEANP